ncbi:MAG: DUF1905 domain-containing protein [Bacteroidota bacterium]
MFDKDVMTLKVKGKVWKYPEFGGWHFFTLGKRVSSRIKALMKGQIRGFGSIRVKARIGDSEWRTSIFPTKTGTYLLPVKASVRHKEGIDTGDVVVVRLELR